MRIFLRLFLGTLHDLCQLGIGLSALAGMYLLVKSVATDDLLLFLFSLVSFTLVTGCGVLRRLLRRYAL